MIARSVVICLLGCANLAPRSAAQDCSGVTFLASAAAVTGLAIYDIATAPASARRYNERQVAVAPIVNMRDRAYGVSFSLPFGRTPRPPAPLQAVPRHKSPSTALLLSLGSTTLPMGAGLVIHSTGGAWMFLGGIVVGPSVGHVYAGQVARGLGTAGLRAAGTAVGISSLVSCLSD
ncbi:MAG TPA: hypothetical protein VIW26_12850 [Gemmatimonadales bacterium]|jgi:hypothetical protein